MRERKSSKEKSEIREDAKRKMPGTQLKSVSNYTHRVFQCSVKEFLIIAAEITCIHQRARETSILEV